ncbi:MAG: hypothetical protein AAB390_00205 [Patescibacteria group bacterium]
MGFFLKKLFFFSLPLIAILLFPFLLFYANGEFIPARRIVAMTLGGQPMIVEKILPFWGAEYSKINIIKIKKPAIITLGNSRVLQFRREFFEGDVFYNGGGIGNLSGFRKAIENLNDDEKPKIILLGLEQSYFNPFNDNHEIPDLTLANNGGNAKLPVNLLNAWRSVYTNVFSGKYALRQLWSRRSEDITRIGLPANVKNSGMRNDGSYDYGDAYAIDDERNNDFQFKDTLRRMEKGVNLFYHGDEISENSIAILAEFLKYCRNRNIQVIGFLPPYAQEIYDKMKLSGKYRYVFKLEEKLKSIFKKNNFSFFDFSDLRSFEGETDEIVDGLHASEAAYRKLFLKMAEADSKLKAYAAKPGSDHDHRRPDDIIIQ